MANFSPGTILKIGSGKFAGKRFTFTTQAVRMPKFIFQHHSRPQSPRSFWSAPGIETSGRDQVRGLPEVSIPGADQKDHGLWGRE